MIVGYTYMYRYVCVSMSMCVDTYIYLWAQRDDSAGNRGKAKTRREGIVLYNAEIRT